MGESKEQPVRIVMPNVDKILSVELEKLHIHSYDYQANVKKDENGYELILRFGEGFNQTESKYFTAEMLEEGSSELLDFIRSTGESCKKIMIADYFKMMKS